jgi:hypothetical protein
MPGAPSSPVGTADTDTVRVATARSTALPGRRVYGRRMRRAAGDLDGGPRGVLRQGQKFLAGEFKAGDQSAGESRAASSAWHSVSALTRPQHHLPLVGGSFDQTGMKQIVPPFGWSWHSCWPALTPATSWRSS